jgi:hypothetical protein
MRFVRCFPSGLVQVIVFRAGSILCYEYMRMKIVEVVEVR